MIKTPLPKSKKKEKLVNGKKYNKTKKRTKKIYLIMINKFFLRFA
jgi:hypothetical protein